MKHTEETKKKISESRKGTPAWNKGTKQEFPEPKACKLCKKLFYKNKHMGPSQWLAREYCSCRCSKIKPTVPPKTCETCQKLFYKDKNTTFDKWPDRKFCSSTCNLRKIHKDRKGTNLSKEWCENLSKAHIGQKSWNAGTKTILSCLTCKKDFYPKNRKIKGVKFCSLQCAGKSQRFKPRYDIRGESHHNWKGGSSTENDQIRHSIEYKKWRHDVFERDDYTCQHCNKKDVTLHADHIKPFGLYPELRLKIDNGRTLCAECHQLIGWSLFKEDNPTKKGSIPWNKGIKGIK